MARAVATSQTTLGRAQVQRAGTGELAVLSGAVLGAGLVQLRSGKIGLAAFLHKRGVPEFPSPRCSCGYAQETAKHVLLHCDRFGTSRGALEHGGRIDCQWLVGEREGASVVTGWWLQHGIAQQFWLAKELEEYTADRADE